MLSLRTFVAALSLLLFAGCAADPVEEPVIVKEAPACNGAPSLCKKRFDEVVYLTAHNAMSHADAFWVAPNQDHNIATQLEDGVRGISLDFHENPGHPNDPLLCHGNCAAGSALLVVELRNIRYFLESYPREVVTILYEGSVADEVVAHVFEQAELEGYVHTQALTEPWPTLEEMIAKGKRVVVFSQDLGGAVPWIHRMWDYTWDTPYSYEKVTDFDCSVGRGSPDNGIFQINHFLTAPLAGEALAKQANAYDVLMPRVQRCIKETGQRPTFLWVDWYATGDAKQVVDELNGVH